MKKSKQERDGCHCVQSVVSCASLEDTYDVPFCRKGACNYRRKRHARSQASCSRILYALLQSNIVIVEEACFQVESISTFGRLVPLSYNGDSRLQYHEYFVLLAQHLPGSCTRLAAEMMSVLTGNVFATICKKHSQTSCAHLSTGGSLSYCQGNMGDYYDDWMINILL